MIQTMLNLNINVFLSVLLPNKYSHTCSILWLHILGLLEGVQAMGMATGNGLLHFHHTEWTADGRHCTADLGQ